MLLNREIKDARDRLMKPTPDNQMSAAKYFTSSQQPPASPSMSREKRKRALSAIDRSPGKKPLKKYGSTTHLDIYNFHGSSDGELDLASTTGSKGSKTVEDTARGSTYGHVESVLLESKPAHGQLFDGSLTEEKRKRCSDQGVMPPASKSASGDQTQPSGSSTTQTMSDPTPKKLGSRNMTATKSTPVGTAQSFELPDSDSRMLSPTISSRSRSDRAQVSHHELRGNASIKDTGVDGNVANEHSEAFQEPRSSASLLSPSKTIIVEKPRTATGQLQVHDKFGNDELSMLWPGIPNAGTPNPVVLLPEQSQGADGHDELSLSVDAHVAGNKMTPMSKSKKRNQTDEADASNPGSDDVAIGLPKEHYKPRPSRTRSGIVTEELVTPEDFSKKPEAIGKSKRKAKRRKTTAFQELRPKSDDEDDEYDRKEVYKAEAPAPLRSSIIAEQAKSSREETDAAEMVQEETKNNVTTSAKPSAPKKPRGRPKKATQFAADSPCRDKDDDQRGKGADFDKPNTNITAPPINGKRKKNEVSLPIVDERQDDSDAESVKANQVHSPQTLEKADKALDEATGNSLVPTKLADKALSASSPQKPLVTRPETPTKALNATSKGPDRHSPISSGKVAYRIGLSKRARIEPLLRIVRK